MLLFLLLCLVFTYLKVIANFRFISPKHVSKRCFCDLWIKEDSQNSPKTPNIDIPWLVPRVKRIQEGATRKNYTSTQPELTIASPSDRGGPHGWTVVGPPPRLTFFLPYHDYNLHPFWFWNVPWSSSRHCLQSHNEKVKEISPGHVAKQSMSLTLNITCKIFVRVRNHCIWCYYFACLTTSCYLYVLQLSLSLCPSLCPW